MKKIISAILAVLMLCAAFAFAGCTDKTPVEKPDTAGPAQTTAAATEKATGTEAPETDDGLPEINFNNEEFYVLSQNDANRHYDIYAEDADNNDSVRDAVHLRNRAVEDRFGVTIKVEFDTFSNVNAAIDRMVKTNSDEYDLCFVHMVQGAGLAMSHDFVAFEDLPYIDLSKPWWDKNLKNGFSIDNHLYMANGDISPSSFSTTSCLYFNKDLFEKHDMDPSLPYKLVTEGKWTIDRLIEFTKDFTKDVDGDSRIDPYSTRDVFGLTSWSYDVPYSLYYGLGGNLVSKDENDLPFYDPDITRDTGIYEKIYETIITNNAYFESADYGNVGKLFINGQALFYDASLLLAGILRDMVDEFGILPMPKFSESGNYRSFVNGASSMVCIPASCRNLERAAIITEALASEAYKTVTPVLYETYLKRKVSRDADSQDMIDYIVRNRVFDMGYINLFDGVGSYVRTMLSSKATNVSGTLAKYESKSKKAITKLIDAYQKTKVK